MNASLGSVRLILLTRGLKGIEKDSNLYIGCNLSQSPPTEVVSGRTERDLLEHDVHEFYS
jgi:hypothetical protein